MPSISIPTTKIFTHINQIREWRQSPVVQNKSIALVYTKGPLNEAHINILHHARNQCEYVVIVFACHPLQFPSQTQYELFPLTQEKSLQQRYGADVQTIKDGNLANVVLLIPNNQLFKYSAPNGVYVRLESETIPCESSWIPKRVAEGECTIATKLILLTQPTKVFIGQRDLIRAMMIVRIVDDLHLLGGNVLQVVLVPTMRDEENLAYNSRLSLIISNCGSSSLRVALSLYDTLNTIVKAYLQDEFKSPILLKSAMEYFSSTNSTNGEYRLDYLRIAHPYDFQDISSIDPSIGAICAISVSFPFRGNVSGDGGDTEMITLTDNIILAARIPSNESGIWGFIRSGLGVNGSSEESNE